MTLATDNSRASALPPTTNASYTTPASPASATAAVADADADDMSERLADALGALNTHGARLSVAVLDSATGAIGVYGNGSYDTASIVKVDILAALLLQAQDAGRVLTTKEQAAAAIMIKHSDNDAATTLWNEIGGAPGLDAANKRLGLSSTRAGENGYWGLTQTTAADQLTLLRDVFDDDPSGSALNAASRGYVQSLMGQVEPDQAWGVPAAADRDSATALKNGWLQRSATRLWDINSIGRIVSDGHAVLIAVLSSGNATQDAGITLVQNAARAALS